jgi:L-ascorbate oxidase
MRNLKTAADYYNREQQTFGDFLAEVKENGVSSTVSDRMAWGSMRMMKADVEDLQGFTGLINGKGPDQNWTGLFTPGERIRLRFINSSAMTYFDVRIPGLEMTVVQADGNNVQPVKVDEFRIGVAETYDVIVKPKDAEAYTIFAESMGRSGFARATLAVQNGLAAPVPELRDPARLTMADMGMDHSNMAGMDHSNMASMDHSNMASMDHSNMASMDHSNMAGMDHSNMAMSKTEDKFYADGSGLIPKAANGGKFLSYSDLKAQKPLYEDREPTREIELRLTGNMERYLWSINGVKYENAEPIRLQYGERVRFKFVNETMMTHPMHLHGMWSILDVGADQWNPIKHTVSVQPGTTVYTETEVDEPGQWAFHCHLAYHASAGMFRKIIVEGGPEIKQAKLATTVTPGGDS